jgi:hypothetical protein
MKTLPLASKPNPSTRSVDELLDTPDSESGRTPLEVMLANMRFYDRQGDRLLKQLERLIVRADDPQSRAEAQETLREFLIMRDKAQAAARDPAPFCHGRLAPTEQTPLPSERRIESIDWENISPQQAAAAYQRIIRAAKAR